MGLGWDMAHRAGPAFRANSQCAVDTGQVGSRTGHQRPQAGGSGQEAPGSAGGGLALTDDEADSQSQQPQDEELRGGLGRQRTGKVRTAGRARVPSGAHQRVPVTYALW